MIAVRPVMAMTSFVIFDILLMASARLSGEIVAAFISTASVVGSA